MKMNKKTIIHLAAFITEDPDKFSPDLQVSGGPLDIMEQDERQGQLPGMEDAGRRKVLSTMQVGPNRDITYEVIVVDNVEEVMKLGEGTKWCFGGSDDWNEQDLAGARKFAEMYTPIYFVLKDGEPFLAASERSGVGWRNREDMQLSQPSPALSAVLQDAGVPEMHFHPPGVEEGLMRAGVINEFQGGSEDSEEYTVELLTTGTGNWWVLFKGTEDLDAFDTETLAVDAAKARGAEQVTVKPNARPGLPPPTDYRVDSWHNRGRGGGAAGPNYDQSGRSFGRRTDRS